MSSGSGDMAKLRSYSISTKDVTFTRKIASFGDAIAMKISKMYAMGPLLHIFSQCPR